MLLTDYCSLLRKWREEFKPKSLEEPLRSEYVESMHELEKMEYYCDLFLYGTRAELEEFRTDEERMVHRIEQRLKQYNMGHATPTIGE